MTSSTATVDSQLDQSEPSDEGLPAEITDYVAAVRARLVDLDPDEVDDLTDDLHSHLAEIRAETEEPFDQIIGSPEQFAAELRQSAGLAQVSSGGLRLGGIARAAERIGRSAERRLAPARDHRWTQATLDFLPELRPAWWVARGYLLTGLLALITGGRLATFLLVPSIGGSTVAGFAVMVALIVASVRFGRRRLDARWARWAAVVSAILATWVAVVLFDQVSGSYAAYGGDAVYVDTADPSIVDTGTYSGELPANIYAVLPDGTPLDQVLLYDESGEPVNLPESGYSFTLDSDWEAESALDESGRAVGNLFPRRLLVPDWSSDPYELQYQVLPPPVIEWGVPITPRSSDGRSSATTEAETTSTPAEPETTTTAEPETTTTEVEDRSTMTDPDGS